MKNMLLKSLNSSASIRLMLKIMLIEGILTELDLPGQT